MMCNRFAPAYRRGQAIIRAGDVVDSATMDALKAAGLNGPNLSWQPMMAALLVALVVVHLSARLFDQRAESRS